MTTSLKIVHTPDALGSPTRTDVLDSVGGIAQQRSATFDALGRLLQDVGGVGQTTVHAYDSAGNAVRTTDALGRTMLRSFDALGRLIAITDPAGGITTIGYDATDRPVSLTDAKGVTTTFVYDGFGDVIQRVSPDWPVRPRRRRSRDQPELPSLLDPRPATAGERTHSSSFSM